MKKRALSLLLALSMMLALLPPAAYAAKPDIRDRFTDLAPNAYYLDAVEWAVENGITTGTGDGTTFSPNRPCSHLEILTFLWRAAGSPQTDAQYPEFGMTGDEYYYTAVCWAQETGATHLALSAVSPATIRSYQLPCYRKNAVYYIWAALGRPDPKAVEGVSPWFSDVNIFSIEDHMWPAIFWSVYAGVTKGTGDGTTFSPWKTCTRAEIITFLYRAYA